MACIYYKTYYRCNAPHDAAAIQAAFEAAAITHVHHFVFNGVLQPDGTYAAAPGWFTQVNDYPMYDTWWLFAPPAEENTAYQFSWTAHNHNGTTDEYLVELVMLPYCSVEIDNAGCNPALLTWLTREGGWAYFSFSGKRTFEVKIPQGKTFQNSDDVLRHHTRPDVYRGMQLTTGPVPRQALDLLESLKYSVQAYFIEEDGNSPLYLPVVIQDGDFTKRKTGDKRFDVTVKLIFAEQVQVQTQ